VVLDPGHPSYLSACLLAGARARPLLLDPADDHQPLRDHLRVRPAEVRERDFRASGISALIWANQSMRAAVAAMRCACREIRATQSAVDGAVQLAPLRELDGAVQLAPLREVFSLMRYDELERDTGRFSGDEP
jgi:hypothetical protein